MRLQWQIKHYTLDITQFDANVMDSIAPISGLSNEVISILVAQEDAKLQEVKKIENCGQT